MDVSKDLRVQSFLDDLQEVTAHKYDIIQTSRKLVFAAIPCVDERIIYGGIMFSLNGDDLGGLFASKNHVSFEFSKGFELNDPNGILEGKGKFRRHLKLKSIEDVEQKTVSLFVQQLNSNN